MKWIRKDKWALFYTSLLLLIILLTAVGIYGLMKPLPESVSFEGEDHEIPDAQFYYDLTYQTKDGDWVSDQSIFDEIIEVINRADSYLLLDMFLFNAYHDRDEEMPEISKRVTEALLSKKESNPDIEIIFITDEFNTGYGSHDSIHLVQLEEAGIHTVISDLTPLRDGKPVYSAFYRTFFQWFGRGENGWISHPLSEEAPSLTARSYLKLLNLKANHRKLVVSDKEAFVTSANPHDGSGLYSNIGFRVTGSVIKDIWAAEKAVASFSTDEPLPFPSDEDFLYDERAEEIDNGDDRVIARHLTESSVKNHVIEAIEYSATDDLIYIGVYYLAKDPIADALLEASRRGVDIRIVLDPNSYSFSQETHGLPNRPSAKHIHEESNGHIDIRWFNIDKEQYHTKLMFVQKQEESIMIGGSSNFTRRNMDDFNLDASIKLTASNESSLSDSVLQYFEKIWTNEDGLYTLPLEEYEDDLSFWKPAVFRLQQWLYFTTY
ncbi:phospholipase D-like domain-containing protein [Alteribacter aurantiacus]|uniref:phospholipase D-like domain-containing protein n=1 Tax=Alteribacter aurantiacus TaxID=254410 RepID=UPI00041D3F4A|nr:phospholipase D-like domain-containing protein [Alteribacter aurantiacus]